MTEKRADRNDVNKLYLFVLFFGIGTFLGLFFLIEVTLKPITYFLLTTFIVALTGNVVLFFQKKEILFYRYMLEYSETSISIKFQRFICAVSNIAIMLFLILYVFFKETFSKIFKEVSKNEVMGSFYTVLIITALGSIAFWGHYFFKKSLHSRKKIK